MNITGMDIVWFFAAVVVLTAWKVAWSERERIWHALTHRGERKHDTISKR